MKLTTKLAALSFVICSTMMPLTAQAKNNNQMQMMLMNNVTAQEQTLSNQINAYVGSGQLSPQQGAAFSSELSQISSQAMMGNPNQVANVMNELNSFSAQINSSLQVPAQYAAVPAYGAATAPGFYNNWRHNNYWNNTNATPAQIKQMQWEQHLESRAAAGQPINTLNANPNLVKQVQWQEHLNSRANAEAQTAEQQEAARVRAKINAEKNASTRW